MRSLLTYNCYKNSFKAEMVPTYWRVSSSYTSECFSFSFLKSQALQKYSETGGRKEPYFTEMLAPLEIYRCQLSAIWSPQLGVQAEGKQTVISYPLSLGPRVRGGLRAFEAYIL